jgi:hypothetical protein
VRGNTAAQMVSTRHGLGKWTYGSELIRTDVSGKLIEDAGVMCMEEAASMTLLAARSEHEGPIVPRRSVCMTPNLKRPAESDSL